VVVDRRGNATPLATGILKVAYQFTLLGIDADDGIAATAETASQTIDHVELLVACGALPRGNIFAIHMERET